jgi:hypothetical protein
MMYNQIWHKYLGAIRILIKKSAASEQMLDVNQTDFQQMGKSRKAVPKFNILFIDGKIAGNLQLSEAARSLTSILMEDTLFQSLLQQNDYEFTFHKFRLHIKNSARREIATAE